MEPERRGAARKVIRGVGLGLILAVSFLALDRLLFLALREGMAGYYRSARADPMPWKTPYGLGQGQALVLGTSRTQNGLVNFVLSRALGMKVYKEAAPGHFPQYNYYFYSKYKQKFGKPALVIYGLDYFMFEKESHSLNLVRLDPSLAVKKISPRGSVNPNSPFLSRASWLFRMKPNIDKFLVDLTAFDRVTESPDPDQEPERVRPNSDRAPEPLPKKRVLPRKPAVWHKRPYGSFPGKEGAYFAQLLQELDRDSVPTFVAFIPEYIGSYETNFEHGKFRDDIRRLAEPLGFVAVLDFNRPEKFDLKNPDYFGDPIGWGISNCHMVDKGARVFSRALATEILLRIKKILRTQSQRRAAET